MRAKKSFGQNFLHDERVISNIIQGLSPNDNELVCEIGPGTGRLTRRLTQVVPIANLICVEADRDMVQHLQEKLPGINVELADAANYPWERFIPKGQRAVVVGNLPYNASTAIYFHLLLNHRDRFRKMVFMFQREVADRLRAESGSKTYGPPSVITNVLTEVSMVVKVPPEAFRPKPKVNSAVLAFEPLEQPRFGLDNEEIDQFNHFVHAVFQQRRKTINNNLKPIVGESRGDILSATGIDPSARAETLKPELLVALWRNVIGSS